MLQKLCLKHHYKSGLSDEYWRPVFAWPSSAQVPLVCVIDWSTGTPWTFKRFQIHVDSSQLCVCSIHYRASNAMNTTLNVDKCCLFSFARLSNMLDIYKILGPMKGVIPTPDIVKIFHLTPDIQAKKCPTPTLKIHPDTRHPPSKRWKMQKLFPSGLCRKCILSFGGDCIPSWHSTLWFSSRHPKLQNILPRHSTLTPPFKGPNISL